MCICVSVYVSMFVLVRLCEVYKCVLCKWDSMCVCICKCTCVLLCVYIRACVTMCECVLYIHTQKHTLGKQITSCP